MSSLATNIANSPIHSPMSGLTFSSATPVVEVNFCGLYMVPIIMTHISVGRISIITQLMLVLDFVSHVAVTNIT